MKAYLNHQQHLLHALDLANIRRGFCAPNPAVGSIIVNEKGEVISEGYHHGPGLPHAEVNAFNNAKINNLENCTLYVTLEPCCHFGRTPPCTDAIIRSGIKNVVYAFRDPNPIVSGKGEEVLHQAGISCAHLSLPEIDQFYQSYQYWHHTKKPYITAKIAMTLNGKIAGKNFSPIKITNDEVNQFTHQQRKKHDAILTTVKTILSDDPQLNARCDGEIFSKPIFVLDSQLKLPVNAKILSTAKNIIVFHAKDASPERQKTLETHNVKCIAIEQVAEGLCLPSIIEYIGQQGVHDLWIEAGGKCFSSFMEKNLLQHAFIYIAPKLIPEGIDAWNIQLTKTFSSQEIQWQQLGSDVIGEINFK